MLMEDCGTGGGLQGAGLPFAVGLLPCSGVLATSVISTSPTEPAGGACQLLLLPASLQHSVT